MVQIRAGGQGPYTLEGRVAVVTGGSGGIGAATAKRLAAAGARVVVGYNNGRDRADAVLKELAGESHLALRIPMEDSLAIAAAAETVREKFGHTDVLINSAGVTRAVAHADLDGLDDATFDRILITNVRGPFSTLRSFAKLLRAAGDSIVVNLSSISGTTGLGSSIAYCASKAALDTIGLSLARVLGPILAGITQLRLTTGSTIVVDSGRHL